MMLSKGLCTGCGGEKMIVNKKYGLCDDCNYERNHSGQSKSEVYKKRQELKKDIRAKQPLPKFERSQPKRYYIKPKRKEVKIKSALSELKISIELEAVQSGEYYCKGCGQSHPGLDKSHILSVGQRKDMELVKENIQLLCRSCHMNWESWNVERMISLLCFEENLAFIKLHDEETYNKITTKIEEHRNNYFLKD